MTRRVIDLNGDVGEGMSIDEELMPLLTSANIACGGHAGDAASMRRAVLQACKADAAIGAHPSFPDREDFGRKERAVSPVEVRRWVTNQILQLRCVADSLGVKLSHVKPHGALYNQSARDPQLASAMVDAVVAVDDRLILFALAKSALAEAGKRRGLCVAAEAFLDRAYLSTGQLSPRTCPGSVIVDEASVLKQALAIAGGNGVPTLDGDTLRLQADTVCLHGDGANAVVLARRIRERFASEGIAVRSAARFLRPLIR